MSLKKKITIAALTLSLSDLALAAHPPLDRPTPPPCCADGICYPNAAEWGWYRTKWRRWPGDTRDLVPAAPAPMKDLGPDIPSYETPRPEDEDRRAPPKTTLPAEEPSEAEAPGAAPGAAPTRPSAGGGLDASPAPSTPSLTPRTAPLVPETSPLVPQTSPLAPPSMPEPSPLGPPARMPWEENGAEPTGDWDPPPSLPSATAAARQPGMAAPRGDRAGQFTPRQPSAAPQKAPSQDPPPSLPVALASATHY